MKDAAGFSGARLARLDTYFNLEVAQGRLPGAALLIERHGERVVERVWGYRNRASAAPMTLDTIFRIYSMTKPVASLALVTLVAEGRLQLNQPVAEFIPAFADARVLRDGSLVAPDRPPTVYDLLRHTAGLIYERGGGPLAPTYRDADLLAGDPTNEAFAARVAALPLAHQPGSVWDYSHATDVLGRVIEVVAGRTLGQVLRSRVLEPLRMGDTGFSVPEASHPRLAEALPGDTLSDDGAPPVRPAPAPRLRAGRHGSRLHAGGLRPIRAHAAGRRHGGRRHPARSPQPGLHERRSHRAPPPASRACPARCSTRPTASASVSRFAPRSAGRARRGRSASSAGPASPAPASGVDPAEDMVVVLLTQAPRQRVRSRTAIKALVYDALVGKAALKREGRGGR